jgi:Na+/proline symporter
MKALVLLCAVFFGIFMIPVAFGIIGGIFGVVVGLFGAIFGMIAGLFGVIFGGIFSIFGWGDDHDWYFGPHINIFGVAAIALLIILVSKSSRTKNRS